jgi:hypothetical protein
MSGRFVAALVVLLLALGGGALLLKQREGAQRPAGAAALGQPVLKGLKAADIAAIAIRDGGSALTLELKDGEWRIAERNGFAADAEKVRELVLKAIELKVGQSEPIGEADRARLKLDGSGGLLEFRGADAKPLARLAVGAKFFKREPQNPERAIGDGRYVQLPEDPKTVIVVSDPLTLASTKSADWIRRTGFAAEKVKAMEVTLAGGEKWRIERARDDAGWKLTPSRPGEKLDTIRANSASYSLNRVELADVAAPNLKAADAGLDKPAARITATTFDGLTYTLTLGRPAGDDVPVRVAVAGTGKASGPDAAERQKSIDERLPRERALAAHTLLIARSKFDDILRPRAELLEKKEGAKK